MISPEEQAKIDAALDAALEELDSDEEGDVPPPLRTPSNADPSPQSIPPSDHQLFTSMLQEMLDDGSGGEAASAAAVRELLASEGLRSENNAVLGRFMQEIQSRLQSELGASQEELHSTPASPIATKSETTETPKRNVPPSDDEQAVHSAISNLVQGLSQQVNIEDDEVDMDDLPDMDDPELVYRFMENMMGPGMGNIDPNSPSFNPDAVIDGMMEQLLCKDLMYEPMKQVAEKFPEWLESKRESLSPEEYEMRSKQCACFIKVVQVYESEPNNMAKLTELMQEVQEYGQPPAEIIQEIAPDIELDANGVPKMGDSDGIPNMGQEECRIM